MTFIRECLLLRSNSLDLTCYCLLRFYTIVLPELWFWISHIQAKDMNFLFRCVFFLLKSPIQISILTISKYSPLIYID